MPESDENSLGLIESSNLHGRGRGKIIPKPKAAARIAGEIRKALSTIDDNIITPPSKRTLSDERDSIGVKKKPNVSLHRPLTRSFAAQLADLKRINQKKAKEKEEAAEKITIDSNKEECNDLNVSMFVHSTEEKEIEMKDAENDDDKEESVIDIDACDKNNALALVEYIDDIYFFYKSIEIESCVPPNYMDKQPDLNGKMRAILIDWLIEVHYKFELMDETLYLTINVIDRFLALNQILRKKLQLVGVTALLLACKYEEVSVPVVDDLILISDKAYTRKEVLDMEKLMVTTLQFNFSLPTPYVFMKRSLKAAQSDRKLEVLSFYIMELCLVEYEMLKYLPSMLAASAIYTAQSILKGFQEWNKTCEMHSGYNVEQLRESSRKMVVFHHESGKGKLTGVHRKYNTSKFGFAARIASAEFLL